MVGLTCGGPDMWWAWHVVCQACGVPGMWCARHVVCLACGVPGMWCAWHVVASICPFIHAYVDRMRDTVVHVRAFLYAINI